MFEWMISNSTGVKLPLLPSVLKLGIITHASLYEYIFIFLYIYIIYINMSIFNIIKIDRTSCVILPSCRRNDLPGG